MLVANTRRAFTVALFASIVITVCRLTENTVLAEPESKLPGNRTDAESGSSLADVKVWLISFVAILVISLVGLLSVAVVPLVQSTYYNHFIQYLVALAVGSLTGDAMLHLLPHAIVKSAMESAHAARCHDEKQTVFKGLVALGGVYFFFMAEKIVALVTEYNTEQSAIEEQQRLGSEDNDNSRAKEKQRRLYGARSCDDIMTTGLSSKALRSIDNYKMQECESDSEAEQQQQQQQQQQRQAVPLNRLEPPGGSPSKSPADADDEAKEADGDAGEVKLVVPDAKPQAGHGHGHGHGHEMPESMASVAWMVILGDGLHNFTDGLAIGAAFAQSITGGISTSIAVFCHELPHELGDFAVLLKTGMRVRQALFYNVLSSVLAAVGMVIGILLGNVTSASYWIFAITGGIFIYISLVDMLPELNLVNVKPGESRIAHFILQNAGIMTGVTVMFLIAMFEENIKGLLGDSGHGEEAAAGSC